MGADISTLNPVAFQLCRQFLAAFPAAIVTSTRRSLMEQCTAMADNVLLNRHWIRETYVSSAPADAAQEWVDGMTEGAGPAHVAAGLLAVLEPFALADLRCLSWHLSGDAFDVMPGDDKAPSLLLADLVAGQLAGGGHGKVLTSEGGLRRWHVQVI